MAKLVTRSQSDVYLIGQPISQFGGLVLPTTNEVLQVYYFYHKNENLTQSNAIENVVDQIILIWNKARVPCAEKRNIIRKLELLLQKYRNICRNKTRKGVSQKAKEEEFKCQIRSLFDVAHHNAMELIKIEEDKTFLTDQRTERKYVLGAIDTALSEKEQRKRERVQAELHRKLKEENIKKRKVEDVEELESTDTELQSHGSSTERESDFEDGEELEDLPSISENQAAATSSTSANARSAKLKVSDIITPALSAALDRTNTSNRKAAFIIGSATSSLNDANVALSVSSIRRARIKARSTVAATVKANFNSAAPLVVHMDGKLLPAISGKPEKEDRLAVLVTGRNMEKLLGVPAMRAGTGENIAQTTFDTLSDWNIQDKVIGMSFDTTAANTGLKNGACVLIEKKMGKQLLWLPCRHHIFEVICGDVFKALFGKTCGLDVLLFKRFKENWISINTETYEPCNDARLNADLAALKTETVKFAVAALQKDKLPRDDYRELLEVTLIFCGEVPPCGIHFRTPGAFHHARWMSKLIYVLKIYLFKNQFKITKKELNCCLEFALFVALIYVRFWITSPDACDSAINDLKLIQSIVHYKPINATIYKSAISAIGRHLWYLSQELVPMSLFSDKVSSNEKETLVTKLKLFLTEDDGNSTRSIRSRKGELPSKDVLNSCSFDLDSFLGPSSDFMFRLLQLDTAFLDSPVTSWSDLPSYCTAKDIISSLTVVNDSAERGVALATTFNSTITKQEEQKQFLFQIVESHRKLCPDATRKYLFTPK